jgi:muramoyltetrapeptide carboxypeptidase
MDMLTSRSIASLLALLVLSWLPGTSGIAEEKGSSNAALYPAALKPGDAIAIVAPAGPMSAEEVERGAKKLESLGFKVRLPQDLDRQHRFFAGDDKLRAAELMAAFADDKVDAIFAARGGYGAMRILEALDYEVIRAHPKILIGYSDITALHNAIYQKTGLVTFHGPNVQGGFGTSKGMTPFTEKYFWRALGHDRQESPGYAFLTGDASNSRSASIPPMESLTKGVARGRLVGGNLSLVHAVIGTPYEVETDGKVLFLEDIGEAPYRVDRMLQTLKLAGKLDNLKGVVLGAFSRRDEEDTSGETTSIDEVLREYFAELGIPVVNRFPAGHQPENATLPIGGLVEVNGDEPGVRIIENPVRPR